MSIIPAGQIPKQRPKQWITDQAAHSYFTNIETLLRQLSAKAGSGDTGIDGLVIGVDVQAYNPNLDAFSALSPNENSFIVGNGTEFVTQTSEQARDSLNVYSKEEVNALIPDLTIAQVSARVSLGI